MNGQLSPFQYYDYQLCKKGVEISNLNYLGRTTYWKMQHAVNRMEWDALSSNKWMFYVHMSSYGIPVPRLYGYYDRINGRTTEGNPLRCAADLKSLLEKHDITEFVIKPVKGGKGINVLVLKCREESFMYEALDGKVFALDDLVEFMSAKPYLVQDRVKQHDLISSLNPYTLNTIRAVTFIDVHGEPHIHWTGMRMGRKGSNIDNAHAGGISMNVDVLTGEIGKWSLMSGNTNKFTAHPDTGVELFGKRVPHWEDIKELSLRAARLCPLGAVGWDIALSQDGPVLIEVNREWAYRQPQRRGPYLTDEVRNHLSGYGIKQL